MAVQSSNLKSKILNLPQKPGVYRFLDETGAVLYIGKAKNLRARVRQYLAGNDERPQIPFLMEEAADLDYTVVNTELESLYLERTLIQQYHPKYNIELKDDKSYAFIKIDYSTQIPQVIVVRKLDSPSGIRPHLNPLPVCRQGRLARRGGEGGDFFGPYTSAKKIRDLIFTVRKIFGLCAAKRTGKPCFYFHLHRCPGVCGGEMSLGDYRDHLKKIKQFLLGKIAPVIKQIKMEMQVAAKQKKFEVAARLRDQLRAIEMLEAKQNVIMAKPANWDIINLARDEGMWCVNLFKIRSGKMLDKANFIYESKLSEPTNIYGYKTLETFLETYYSETSDTPKEIFLAPTVASGLPSNADLIKSLIKNRFKKTVKITVPKKGKAAELVRLSQTNAQEYLKNYLNEKAGHLDKIQRGLQGLKEILKLPSIPRRIEGYDISNIQGTNPVGSMVVFADGLPAKSLYRKFKIRTKETPDDIAMMKEMLTRRFIRSDRNFQFSSASRRTNFQKKSNPPAGGQNQNSKPWPLPDLIVIDGGRSQLNAALKILNAKRYTLNATFIIGLAKRIEEIFLPHQKDPILLPRDNPALQLLQRLRDEAHRFGLALHRDLRSKQAVKSALDDIPGVGPKTKKLLKQRFGTVANVREASLDELTKAVGKKLAKVIRSNL